MKPEEIKAIPGLVFWETEDSRYRYNPAQARELALALTQAADRAEKPPVIEFRLDNGAGIELRKMASGGQRLYIYEASGKMFDWWYIPTAEAIRFFREALVLVGPR